MTGISTGLQARAALAAGLTLILALTGSVALAQLADTAETTDGAVRNADAAPEEPKSGQADSAAAAISQPVIQPLASDEVVLAWPKTEARALLEVIEGIGEEGLLVQDYRPEALRAAIEAGEGDELNRIASKSFAWLAEDLRDGRTPKTARRHWFVVDPDQDDMPTTKLMERAIALRDVAGVLAGLAPTHPDYQALKEELAATAESETDRRALIRANMDRWRWLRRDLGKIYLITNVPEFQLRLAVNDKIIRSYRTIVGKPGRTATPQLAETVSAVVFHPTWTVPQSIVQGEGLGERVLADPDWASAEGFKVRQTADGTIHLVQQPGPGNSLGEMKIDIPNRHAIYFHDTPTKSLFNRKVRAFSHGCIRTERAVELGMTLAILGAGKDRQEVADILRSGNYTKVQLTRTFPAYITYFTFALGIDGELRQFADIYSRDKPVLDSFAAPRQVKTDQRASAKEIAKLDSPA
jgi:murein L,D-transpeptidase YcbB/YkuD